MTRRTRQSELDDARALARARAEFISHASHEIRTPLHGIVGYTTLLLGTELSDEQRSFANALRTSVESLLSVVNDVLDISRLDAGALRLEATGFDLVALLRGVIEMFSEAAHAKGMTLRLDLEGLAHPRLKGDPGRLRQVLVNLVANAVKFTDVGSVVVRADTRPAADGTIEVAMSVTDTGPGIPAEAQARLFEPFSRLRQQGGADKPGTGLGLAICSQLVGLMGGSIDVDSSPGRGSTFSLTLRLTEDHGALAQEATEQVDVDALRVYVADDDPRSRRELLFSLAAAGVGTAGSGPAAALPEALRAARVAGCMPDIAIVGHVRDQEGDVAIAKAVRSDPRLAGVSLVLAPVSGVRGHAREAREAGYRAYVPRPFQGAELLQCLRAVARARRETAGAGDPHLITRHTVADTSAGRAVSRVLIADDDPTSREVTRLQVERLGFSADTVSGGRAAVEAAATGAYPLILMDCQMRDLDGLAAAAEIRRLDPGGHRSVIVALTADVSPEQRRACQEGGMDDFLEKPVRAQTLAALLGKHLGRGDTCATAPGAQQRDDDPDIGAMDLLSADIGPEMTLDLAREYLADVEHSLERLGSGRPDVTTVKREGHRLIGGARTLGLARFERLWRTLSDGQREGARGLSVVLDELRAACGELRGWIESQQEKQNA